MPSTLTVTQSAAYEASELPAGADVPVVTVRDEIVNTTAVLGIDPRTGKFGGDPESQFALAFENLLTLLSQANVAAEEIGLVTVYIPGPEYRQYINKPWLKAFPDEHDRPARKTNHVHLPDGAFVQLQAAGVIGKRRIQLEIPGLAHRDPLPMGCQLGDLLYSSVISAQDPSDGSNVVDKLAQIDRCFANTELLLQQAGGSLDDVIHLWVFLSDFAFQPAMVESWVKTWPRDGDRPARKTLRYNLGGDSLIQVQATAVLSGGRSNHEIPGVGHHDPIPMASKIGNLLYSSGISGTQPGENGDRRVEAVEGLEQQIEWCQRNVESLLEQAGGSVSDVCLLTVLVSDFQAVSFVQESWARSFPDPTRRPGIKFIDWRISGGMQVQYHVAALID